MSRIYLALARLLVGASSISILGEGHDNLLDPSIRKFSIRLCGADSLLIFSQCVTVEQEMHTHIHTPFDILH